MILIEMIFEREPVPAARARSGGNHFYTPDTYANYKLALANKIKERYAQMRLNVVKGKGRRQYLKANRFGVIALFYRSKDSGDTDNFLKGLKDAIQDSGVIGDDCQIDWDFSAKLIDRNRPRVEFILCKSPVTHIDYVLYIFNTIKIVIGKFCSYE